MSDDLGGALWLTSPADDALVAVDPATLAVRARLAAPRGAAQLTLDVAGRALFVTGALDTRVARVALDDDTVTFIDVPCGGGAGIAIDAVRARVWLACPHDDAVVAIDPVALAVVERVAVAGRPTSVGVRGDTLFVTSAAAPASLVEVALADGARVRGVAPLPVVGTGAAVQAGALAFAAGALAPLVAYQRVDHDSRAGGPAQGGYGSVRDDAPRIEPLLFGPARDGVGEVLRPAIFDGGPRVLSSPAALAVAPDGSVLLAGLATDVVLRLDVAQRDASGRPPLLGALRTGRGPRGLALSPDGATVFVDVGFDGAVAAIATDALVGDVEPARVARREVVDARLSPAARRGRALFFDAKNTHLTPSGVVSCGTCHPDGGEDGLVWFLHTTSIAPKARRTQPAWGARAALTPFHWDGAFDDTAALTRATIVELLEGDALLVDLDDLAAFMAEAPLPPARPIQDADAELVARGRVLFEDPAVGCASCHAGALFADGERHDVLGPTGDAARDVVLGTSTPSLVGVRARAPYLHDGRAATLADVIAGADGRHGDVRALTGDDRRALAAFLSSL